MSGISIQDLINYVKVTDQQLDQQCSSVHLREVALSMTSWEVFAPYLGLSAAEVDGIKEDGTKHEHRTFLTLDKWKSKMVFKATYRTLIEVCLKLKNAELAEKVSRLAKEGPVQPDNGAVAPGPARPQPPKQKSRLNEKPRLVHLLKLKEKGEEVEIMKTVAPIWKKFGLYLDFDENGEHLENIAADETLKAPMDKCQAMFQHWLRGNGEQPPTWAKVIEILHDAEHSGLAKKLETILS